MNGCRSLRPLAVTQETRYLPGRFAAAAAAASLAYATLPSRNVNEIGQNVASLKYGAAVRLFCVCMVLVLSDRMQHRGNPEHRDYRQPAEQNKLQCLDFSKLFRVRSEDSGTSGDQPEGGGANPTRTLHAIEGNS